MQRRSINQLSGTGTKDKVWYSENYVNPKKRNIVWVVAIAAILMLFIWPFNLSGAVLGGGSSSGVFSVSKTRKVCFALGNLQYQASTGQWRFADHQWDYVGTQTPDREWKVYGGMVSGSDNADISKDYEGWIDLFGWGSGDNPTNTSSEKVDYPSFVDWGQNCSGGWRTLTEAEWVYVLYTRKTSSGVRYAKAIVNDVKGLILLPDNWSKSKYSLKETNRDEADFISNKISESTWNKIFSPAGAVFLPAAGQRDGKTVRGVGLWGYYWLAPTGDDGSSSVYFDDGDMIAEPSYYGKGCSVRLVRSAK